MFKIGRNNTKVVRAEGSHLVTSDGRRIFDFTSAWSVMNAGWGNPHLDREATKYLSLPFAPNWCPTDAAVNFQTHLDTELPGYRAIFACTGTSAVEIALRLSCIVTGRDRVMSIRDSYHGSSLGVLLFHGSTEYGTSTAEPWIGLNNTSIPWSLSTDVVLEVLLDNIKLEGPPAALLIEPLPTSSGTSQRPEDFFTSIQSLSREYGFLIVCDEIVTGINRTGEFIYSNCISLRPDVVVLGKAITNGYYPVSLAAYRKELSPLFNSDFFQSTYFGSPFGLNIATKTLEYHREEKLGSRAATVWSCLSSHVQASIQNREEIIGFDGVGLVASLQLNWDLLRKRTSVPQLEDDLISAGVFCAFSDHRSDLMLMPPLSSSVDDTLASVDVVLEHFF